MVLKKRLSQNLIRLRRQKNWTQEMAAELCDLSPRFWGKMERCEASATLATLEKIETGMGVTIEDLLLQEEDVPLLPRKRISARGKDENTPAAAGGDGDLRP